MNDTGQKRNEQYWAAFFEELPSDKLGLKIPSVYDSHYRDFHMGITGCYIRVSQRLRPSGIAAAFVMKGSAQDFFHSLIKQQNKWLRISQLQINFKEVNYNETEPVFYFRYFDCCCTPC